MYDFDLTDWQWEPWADEPHECELGCHNEFASKPWSDAPYHRHRRAKTPACWMAKALLAAHYRRYRKRREAGTRKCVDCNIWIVGRAANAKRCEQCAYQHRLAANRAYKMRT